MAPTMSSDKSAQQKLPEVLPVAQAQTMPSESSGTSSSSHEIIYYPDTPNRFAAMRRRSEPIRTSRLQTELLEAAEEMYREIPESDPSIVCPGAPARLPAVSRRSDINPVRRLSAEVLRATAPAPAPGASTQASEKKIEYDENGIPFPPSPKDDPNKVCPGAPKKLRTARRYMNLMPVPLSFDSLPQLAPAQAFGPVLAPAQAPVQAIAQAPAPAHAQVSAQAPVIPTIANEAQVPAQNEARLPPSPAYDPTRICPGAPRRSSSGMSRITGRGAPAPAPSTPVTGRAPVPSKFRDEKKEQE